MDYFYNLDSIIYEEIEKQKKIAIYPFGKIGMQAKEILNQRYGREAIVIDNKLAKYNSRIITIEQFLRNVEAGITVILCTTDSNLNEMLLCDLKEKINDKVTIRNVLEPIVRHVPEKAEYFCKLKSLCAVRKAKNFKLKRIGKENDGAYIMLDDMTDVEIAYSFGIGNEISWDKCVADRGINVYCYDPTINELPEDYPGLHFERIGITGKDDAAKRLYSLQTILENNGHDKKDNMLLKMDVEGAEWDFLQETSSEIFEKFVQITFELHDMTDMANAEKIISALQKIKKTHEPVWIHANNCDGMVQEADGMKLPRLLEITFVNKKKYELCDTAYSCPISIDMPNIKEYLDAELGEWGSEKA